MANYEQPAYVEKRVRFFDGQFIKDQDLIDEQKYHLDRQRRYARALTVSGIVQGLAVNAAVDQVNVEPGTAVDKQGRQVVLASTSSAISVKDYRGQTVQLVIYYAEEASDQAQEGSAGYARFHERPQLLISTQQETMPDVAIILAELTIDNDGQVAVNNSVRQYAGVRFPSGEVETQRWPTLRADGAGQLALTGDMTITGKLQVDGIDGDLRVDGSHYVTGRVGIGAANPNSRLSVAGGVAVGAGYASNEKAPDEGLLVEGNVGIGTASPQDKLDLHGVLRFNGDANTRLYASTRGNAKALVVDAHWDELEIKGRVIDWTGSDLHIGYSNNHSSHSVFFGNGGLRAVELRGKTSLVVGGDATVRGDTTVNGNLNLLGRLTVGHQPFIQVREYSNASERDTGYRVIDWVAAVIGFESGSGDILENGAGRIIAVRLYDSGGRWRIRADFRSHNVHESWWVQVMFIRRSLVG